MLHKLRRRLKEEKGFTLIELLVVILIIAILAAVAIPTFLNQRGKAYDSNAQSMVKAMQIAEETYATSNDGSYTTDLAALQSLDPSIKDTSSATANAPTGVSSNGYTVSATANNTSDVFSIVENNGQQTDLCVHGSGGGNPGACPSSGTW
jgi:type IV pilus assembly protein PilA